MTRSCLPASVAFALALFATSASGIDFPTMKSGLWEQKLSRDGPQQPPIVTKICIDAAVQKEMLAMGMGSMKSACSKNDIRREGNRMFGEAECKLGESTIRSKSVTAFTGDTAYRTEVKASYDPPFMGKTTSTTVIDAKWTGPCPAGVKAGDVIMPDGKTINMRAMAAPPKQ
jgi:Protein of unknown function (DUF3617)